MRSSTRTCEISAAKIWLAIILTCRILDSINVKILICYRLCLKIRHTQLMIIFKRTADSRRRYRRGRGEGRGRRGEKMKTKVARHVWGVPPYLPLNHVWPHWWRREGWFCLDFLWIGRRGREAPWQAYLLLSDAVRLSRIAVCYGVV